LSGLYHEARLLYSSELSDQQKRTALVTLAFENCPKAGSSGSDIVRFEIIDPLVRDYVLASAAKCKGWADTSFNSRVVKMPKQVFAKIVAAEFDCESDDDSDGFRMSCKVLNEYAKLFRDEDFPSDVRARFLNAASKDDVIAIIVEQMDRNSHDAEPWGTFKNAIESATRSSTLIMSIFEWMKQLAS